ncbi:MAG: gliding motility-associated C-terminal domain-containing protein [Flavobacteriales bacterium]|nr:gliding motility-associated C-terminal domain-containing protein [Flavobacteriales bacterium]
MFEESNVNYNPSVYFDGIDDILTTSLGVNAYTSDFAIFSVTSLLSTTVQGALFHNHVTTSGNGDLTSFQLDANGVTYRYRNGTDISGVDGLVLGPFNSKFRLFAVQNQNSGFNTFVESYESGVSTNSTTFSGNNRGQVFQHYVLGANRIAGTIFTGTFSKYYAGEFLIFPAVISSTDRKKVETYLAIKFGFTLDRTGGGTNGNYVATDDTDIWQAALTAIYHNDVIGIGRDDAEALMQKQSHSEDDSVRIYVGSIANANANNIGVINSDTSYVLIGHNQGEYCETSASSSEIPTLLNATRLDREWKVTKTNFSDLFSIDIKPSNCPPALVGSLSHLKLLVDDDGDFTNAQVFGVADGITFSYSSGVLSITGISDIHLPNNSTRYITVASEIVEAAISSSGSICAGDSTLLMIALTIGTGPIDVLFSDGITTDTIFGLTTFDSIYVSPSITTVYSVEAIRGYGFDCCSTIAPTSTVTVTVNPNPVVVANSSNLSICIGDVVQLTGSGADSYVWSNGIVDGQMVSPLDTTTYSVVGMDVFGCEGQDNITINVIFNPIPIFQVDTVITGTEIYFVNTSVGADTYFWDFGDGSISTDMDPSHTYADPGSYEVCLIVMNSFGCADTLCQFMTIIPAEIRFPSIISPNNDGANDFLAFEYLEFYPNNELTIFNRWGSELFKQAGYMNNWNGNNHPDGIYYYVLILPDSGEKYSGFFHMVR